MMLLVLLRISVSVDACKSEPKRWISIQAAPCTLASDCDWSNECMQMLTHVLLLLLMNQCVLGARNHQAAAARLWCGHVGVRRAGKETPVAIY